MLTPHRRHYGLHWRSERPSATELGFTVGNMTRILALVLLFGLVGTMDYADAQRAEANAARESYATQQAALLACLNGGDSGYYTTDNNGNRHHIVCETYTVSDENTDKRRGM